MFPFFLFPHFSFDTLPDFLELPETNGRDCFKNISFLYSRLEKGGKGKVLEKLFLDMEEGIAEIEKQSNKENISYKKSGEAKVIGKAFSQIDVYSFYPKSWNKDISPINSDETKDEEYRRTKYFFSGKTKYGREIKWEGYFTALTLPQPWHDASISIRRNFPFASFLESTEPSMIDMPPTCKDTIYVAGVVFSDKEYEKEYSYISPFGLLRPGTEVTVPVGGKNVPRSATVKSIKAFNKRDEIFLKGLKEIITSSDL